MVKAHVRFLNITIACVAAAALLTFCTPAPAQEKGTYLPCSKLAGDAGVLVKAAKMGVKELKIPDDPYLHAVVTLAEAALGSAEPQAWLKLWKASCLKGQA